MMSLVPALAFAANELVATVDEQEVTLTLTLDAQLSGTDETVLNVFQDGKKLATTMTVAATETTGSTTVTVAPAATAKTYTFAVKKTDGTDVATAAPVTVAADP